MKLSTRRHLSLFFLRLAACAVLGALFGAAVGATALKPAFSGGVLGALAGAVYAASLMTFIGGAEMFLPRTHVGRAFDRAPLFVILAVKTIVYSAVILVFIGGRLGLQVATMVAGVTLGGELAHTFEQQARATFPLGQMVSLSFLVVFLFLLQMQLIRLVGNRTFRALAFGRYHRPRTEERFFLFVDIVGSTPLAERLGPTAVHEFLDRVFQLASDPIDEHAGEVYQYVGDEIVITWTVPEGRIAARPVACLFAIEEALNVAGPDFERRFGSMPRLRAALHAGPVIAGEVGGSRRAIVFHGDVMNTASRLENATRELQRSFLVSEDALSRLDGTDAYALVDLGPQQLRGRAAPLRAYAVAPQAIFRQNPRARADFRTPG
jgi:adenylate cyclase